MKTIKIDRFHVVECWWCVNDFANINRALAQYKDALRHSQQFSTPTLPVWSINSAVLIIGSTSKAFIRQYFGSLADGQD